MTKIKLALIIIPVIVLAILLIFFETVTDNVIAIADPHTACLTLFEQKAAIHVIFEGQSLSSLPTDTQEKITESFKKFEELDCLDSITEEEQMQILMKFGVIGR